MKKTETTSDWILAEMKKKHNTLWGISYIAMVQFSLKHFVWNILLSERKAPLINRKSFCANVFQKVSFSILLYDHEVLFLIVLVFLENRQKFKSYIKDDWKVWKKWFWWSLLENVFSFDQWLDELGGEVQFHQRQNIEMYIGSTCIADGELVNVLSGNPFWQRPCRSVHIESFSRHGSRCASSKCSFQQSSCCRCCRLKEVPWCETDNES